MQRGELSFGFSVEGPDTSLLISTLPFPGFFFFFFDQVVKYILSPQEILPL